MAALFWPWRICLLLISEILVSGETVVEGLVGESVILPCGLLPEGELEWRRGPEPILIITGKQDVLQFPGLWNRDFSLAGVSDLKVRSLRRGRHEDLFTCRTGGRSTHIRIKLLDRITGVQIPEASNGILTLVVGTPKTLTCSVAGDPSTPIHYQWDVDGTDISAQNSMTFILTADKSTKMVGCRAHNRFSNGTELSSLNVRVTLNVLYLEIRRGPMTINATESQQITIPCRVEGYPKPSYQWFKSKRLASTTSEYKIAGVKRSDAGVYTCRANNLAGDKISSIRLTVLYPPDVLLSYNPATQTLACAAEGVPDNYNFSVWEHRLDGKLLQTLGSPSTVSPVSLQLPGTLTYEDMGFYECKVSNGIKSAKKGRIFVSVQTPAVFQKSTVLQITEGGTGTLSASFYTYSSTPNVTVRWTKSGETTTLVSHSETIGLVKLEIRGQIVDIIGTVTALTLIDVSLSDGGNYTLVVRNDINGVTEARNLTVEVQITEVPKSHIGVIGGAIGGGFGALMVVSFMVAIVVWKLRKGGFARSGSGPSTENKSAVDKDGGMTGEGLVKVYDNLDKIPDYVNTTLEKTYTDLNLKAEDKPDLPESGDSIVGANHTTSETHYENIAVSKRTEPISNNAQYEEIALPKMRGPVTNNAQYEDITLPNM